MNFNCVYIDHIATPKQLFGEKIDYRISGSGLFQYFLDTLQMNNPIHLSVYGPWRGGWQEGGILIKGPEYSMMGFF